VQPRIFIGLRLLEYYRVSLGDLLKIIGGKQYLNYHKSKCPRDFLHLEVFLAVLKSPVFFETS
jgi:hypothetical protein